jgi:hypothetical protein
MQNQPQNGIQPAIANIQPAIANIKNASANVANQISEVSNNIANNVASATKTVTDNLQEFSSPQKITSASEEFLNSNGIIAKFVFLILVIIVFLFLMNLGIYLIGYFAQPPNNPYIIDGLIQGTNYVVIPRDPKKPKSVVLKHSNNQKGGMEFSWSFWLNLQNNTNHKSQYSHIFSIGDSNFDSTTGIASVENGPGVYLANVDVSGNQVQSANLHVVMDTIPDGITNNQSVDVTNLPYDKWFNVIIRMKNTVLDIYINGIITSRLNFINVPKQNYSDVVICGNGGFIGSLSNLRYYDYALNVFEIGSVVYSGPRLSAATINQTATTKNGYNYLSNSWYASKLNN